MTRLLSKDTKPLSRRAFTKRLGSLAGAVSLAPVLSSCDSVRSTEPLLLSASTDGTGQHFIGAYTVQGQPQFSTSVPQRAHGMLLNPSDSSEAIFFSRRPGTQLHRINFADSTVAGSTLAASIHSAAGQHFYGHGCFSADGQWLYTTENDVENGRGLVCVRDRESLAVQFQFPSYGIGPHELKMMPDGKTLVVANGGLLTHPDQPRKVLNLDTMQPSLVYIDSQTGALLGEYRLPNAKLSIRHIDVNAAGVVAVTTQYQAESASEVPLLASHAGQDQMQVFAMEAYGWGSLKNYCGAVAFAKPETTGGLQTNSNIAAVTSPRGGRIALFDFKQQRKIASFSAKDVCGVGYSSALDSFVATSGRGAIYRINHSQHAGQNRQIEKIGMSAGRHWDNHLLMV